MTPERFFKLCACNEIVVYSLQIIGFSLVELQFGISKLKTRADTLPETQERYFIAALCDAYGCRLYFDSLLRLFVV
jgi:hypothetical protein